MGREIRRVPGTWRHPRTAQGSYIPMYAYFPYNAKEIAEGLRDGWLSNTTPHYGCDVMPDWPDAERTHWQMYEDVTEGTPISPALETAEGLAQWLANHHASAFAGQTATYDQWLATIRRGNAVSAVFDGASIHSGVAYEAEHDAPRKE